MSIFDTPASPQETAGHRAAKVLLSGILRAFFFWNTGRWLYIFRDEDGVFAYHSGASAAEWFCEKMEAMGVLVEAGRRGYRVTIRYDAVDAYSSFLVDRGFDIDEIASTFIILFIYGVIELLPEGAEPFDAKFYENSDGITSFDTREMLNALTELGYATREDEKFAWTARMLKLIADIHAPWIL